MEKDDIRINRGIIHILDSTMAAPVLSDMPFDTGSDFCDFLKGHIYKLISGDDLKTCHFNEGESQVYQALLDYSEENFVPISKMLAGILFDIMNDNIDIPQADFLVIEYRVEGHNSLALLKMNYKVSYTHRTKTEEIGNINAITVQKAILPTEGQRLIEAAFINLEDYSIRMIEKKFEINGEKIDYFSRMFLKCNNALSAKAKIAIVTKAVEDVQKKYYKEDEQFEAQMEAKSIIHTELEEKGALNIPQVIQKIFKEKEEFKEEVQEKLDKYKIAEDEVIPQNENTLKKFEKQHLTTDTGIEIKIPMEQYKNSDNIEFITKEDGTICVLLKNIGHIISK